MNKLNTYQHMNGVVDLDDVAAINLGGSEYYVILMKGGTTHGLGGHSREFIIGPHDSVAVRDEAFKAICAAYHQQEPKP